MRNEPCFCGSGKKQKKCHPDIHPKSAFARLIQFHQTIEKELENQQGEIQCKKGCAKCCYEPFHVSSTEFYYIMNDIIERHGEEKAKEVNKKGYDIWQNIKNNDPQLADELELYLNGEADTKSLKVIEDIVERSSALHYPCPFLNEDSQSCTVYWVRPNVCRAYGVGYFEKMEEDFYLCEEIPSGLEYQEQMTDLTQYKEESQSWIRIHTKEHGNIYDRPYPFYYFMNLLEQNWEIAPKKIREYKQLTSEQAIINRLVRMNKK